MTFCFPMKPIALTFLLMASCADAAVPAPMSGFIQTYCIDCHGPKKQKGDFRVDELKVSATATDAENWQLVLDNLHLGEMPPEKAKQPKPAEVEPVTAWIQSELSRAASVLKGTGGEVVLRRLNRAEYKNTIADLFDVHGDFTAGFPDDTLDHGFDNNGAALMLSAAQVQEYMKAAEFVLARAIAPAKRPETVSKTLTLHDGNRRAIELSRKDLEKRLATFDRLTPDEQKRTREAEAKAKANPDSHGYRFPVRENGTLRPPKPDDGPHLDAVMTVQQYFSGEPSLSFPGRQAGWCKVKAVAYALKNDGKPVRLKFKAEKPYAGMLPKAVSVFAFTDEQPREVEALYYLEPGDRVEFTIMDGAPHSQNRTFIDQPGPFIAIRSFSIEGPVLETWPPPGHRPGFVAKGRDLPEAENLTYLPLSEVTIAERLRKAGYATGFIGKWHLSDRKGADEKGPWELQLRPEHQGFDLNIGGCNRGGPPSFFEPYGIPNIPPRRTGDYLPERLADECISFLRTNQTKPFFLCWWDYSVHYPIQAPEHLIQKYRQRAGIKDPAYAAMTAPIATPTKAAPTATTR